MAREYTRKDCPLWGSDYCARLNMESCRECTVDCVDENSAKAIREELDTIDSNMPEGGISDLFAGDRCVLCKGEPKKKAYYVLTDLAHPEPRRKHAAILGISREPKAGTVMPIELSCCRDCRRGFLILEYVFQVTWVLFALVAFVLMSIRSIREPIAAVWAALPFIIFAAAVALGITLGLVLRRLAIKKYSATTHLNIMEIPKLNLMADRGWFELNREQDRSRLVFSKSPITHGLYSAAPEETRYDQETPVPPDEIV